MRGGIQEYIRQEDLAGDVEEEGGELRAVQHLLGRDLVRLGSAFEPRQRVGKHERVSARSVMQ